MGRFPEVTETQLLERARMAEISTDADVLAAIMRFDHWVKRQNLPYTDAVAQMLHFMRDTMQAQVPLRNALRQRLDPELDEMIGAADRVDDRLSYAVRELVGAFRTDANAISYDPRVLYLGTVIGMAEFFLKDSKDLITVESLYNVTFNQAIFDKISYVGELGAPGTPLTERETRDALEPFETAILRSYFNISFHADNMGGRNVWQEGEEIALGIYRFIQSPASRGQLCSLLPPAARKSECQRATAAAGTPFAKG
ncbi:hypothetical protein [Jannaschia marina]|uniref:hypothetical protein n=1 Tax=Jannaschia marina TaxID=2741674 RepID=UPI0015C763EE|nr:hypothetical protein [Jannaschia marina]